MTAQEKITSEGIRIVTSVLRHLEDDFLLNGVEWYPFSINRAEQEAHGILLDLLPAKEFHLFVEERCQHAQQLKTAIDADSALHPRIQRRKP